MTGFLIKTSYNDILRFKFYLDKAPLTCAAFLKALPFSRSLIHPGFLRKEIWTGKGPDVNILPENVFVLMEPGEIAIGAITPHDTRTSKQLGICYGQAKPIESCNIFGKVFEDDLQLLKVLGQTIWRYGELNLSFEIAFNLY